MGDTTRDALERSLCARLGMCAPDELRVLDAILLRLELGRDRYGALDLGRDRRDWAREEAEEHADALVYRACALISRQDQERRELRADAGRELVEAGLAELVNAARPGEASCSSCGARLMFSARARGGGVCGSCHRDRLRDDVVIDPSAPAVSFAWDMTDADDVEGES